MRPVIAMTGMAGMNGRNPRLIVGLGNPGPEHARTRHNIGFMVLDRLVSQFALVRRPVSIQAELAEGTVGGLPVLALKPLAYMNRSGGPVWQVAQHYGIHCGEMVIVHDDIDLAYERLKIKEKGGDGGHNGVRSLMDALGADEFVRIRMGVGRPEGDMGVVEYVLGEFDAIERITLERFLSRAIEAAEVILCEGAKEAMNRFNRKT